MGLRPVILAIIACCNAAGCATDWPRAIWCAQVELVRIPQGKRMIGTDVYWVPEEEKPQSCFRLDYVLYMGATEVTVAQWEELMGDYWLHRLRHQPVTVSWEQANAYCKALEERLERETGRAWTCRLPREAEWEYAFMYPLPPRCDGWYPGVGGYDDLYSPWESEWFSATCKKEAGVTPCQVKERRPTLIGLYDMLGNVEEWCDGWLTSDVTSMLTEGWRQPPDWDEPMHPVRGSCYNEGINELRPTRRSFAYVGKAGFRVVALPR